MRRLSPMSPALVKSMARYFGQRYISTLWTKHRKSRERHVMVHQRSEQ